MSGSSDLKALIAAERAAGIRPDPLRRLAALLPRDPRGRGGYRRPAEAVEQGAQAAGLRGGRGPRRVAQGARLSARQSSARSIACCSPADSSEAADIAVWQPPRLPIGGGALIARGLAEGPIVARTLKAIEDRWVEAGFPGGEAFERIVARRWPRRG